MLKLPLTRRLCRPLVWLLGGLTVLTAQAQTYTLPPPDVDLVGEIRVVYARHEDRLIDIARQHSIGYNEIVAANPGVDRWIPGEGTPIVLPSRHILPNAPREGIVLNLSEMRLYYYPKPAAGQVPLVITYPVSVGRMDWKTPLGRTTVMRKMTDPPWYPPQSIKVEHARDGEILPDMIPGGSPENPLGRHALYLGIRGYLIHGVDEAKTDGIGMRVTHGCIRMYPENVEKLFGMVSVGTSVYLVDQPVKAGWLADTLFLEAHAPLEEEELPVQVTVQDAIKVVHSKVKDAPVDDVAIELVVEQASGMPVPVAGTTPQQPTYRNNVVTPAARPAPSFVRSSYY